MIYYPVSDLLDSGNETLAGRCAAANIIIGDKPPPLSMMSPQVLAA